MLNSSGARHTRTDGLADDVLRSILLKSARESFGGIMDEARIAAMVAFIDTHNSLRADSGEEGISSYSGYVYEALSHKFDSLPNIIEFDARFAGFVRTLDHLLTNALAPKLVGLPRRKFGEPGIGGLAVLQAPEELASYMSGLVLTFRKRGLLSGQDAGRLKSLIDKISSAPGYLRFLDRVKKDREVTWLLKVVRRLKSDDTLEDSAERDLIVSLGLLLFNLSPNRQIADMLSGITPADTSSALRYQYNAVLALNYMRAGRPEMATAYATAALENAREPEKRAYLYALKGCMAIAEGDYDLATASLKGASEVQGITDRLKGLISFYSGVVLFEKGEYINAIECFEAAGRYSSSDRDLATIHNSIGSCAMHIGDEARADREFQAVEKLSVNLKGARTSQCMLMINSYRGAISGPGGNRGQTVDYYRKAVHTASERGDDRAVADLMGNLGLAYARTSDYPQALQALNTCMAYAEKAGYWAGIRFAYWHLYHTLQKTDTARARHFREIYTEKYPELRDL
ncbi:tetratricopeptide repeat protein [Methanocella sp. MCL-LM]|uniref:tetratricopeptide repeat protein n=1 Tax=Methanocella sp. MCL-LM TaxID=3412035 RepID=UPI003C723594